MTATDLSRKSLRKDQLLELHFDRLPVPSEAFLKLPGAREWWTAMQLHDERRIQAFHRLVVNLQIRANSPATTPLP